MGNAPSALIETWAEFSVGSCIILLRVFTRLKLAGFRGLQADDYLIIPAWFSYAAMTAMAHIVGYAGDTGNIPAAQRASMSDEERALRSLGSKCFMVGWYTYIGLIWTLKMNMLFFYKRVVNGLWVEKYILPAQLLVGATGVSIMFLLGLTCRPFHKLFQIYPDPGPLCTPQSLAFLIPILLMNISTDLMIMAIPLPVLAKMRVSTGRRLGIFILFGAVIFIMIAACLRVYFVIALKTGPTAAIWSCREDLVAVFVGNAPLIRPLFSRKLWLGGYKNSRTPAGESVELSGKFGSDRGNNKRSSRLFYSRDTKATNVESDSMERIMENGRDGELPPMVIQVRKDVHVEGIEDSSGGGKTAWQQAYRNTFRNP
ncbi:hypothetical protein ACO22_02353 [Paracoccidioides brasiliensis]|uniref:Rhodopsin domain-containing protein n=1 Tax=Paracoccidioides brasiliensis TaxID=121759 RepID=A0A1D2JIZ5_PARBR|nr:hypothetical protein ACO22_02353 [Paracoccidioides brasiliensis]